MSTYVSNDSNTKKKRTDKWKFISINGNNMTRKHGRIENYEKKKERKTIKMMSGVKIRHVRFDVRPSFRIIIESGRSLF